MIVAVADVTRRSCKHRARKPAGIDDATIADNIDRILAGAKPGTKTGRPWWNGPVFGKGRPPRVRSVGEKAAKGVIGAIGVFGTATAFAHGYKGNGKVKCEGLGPAVLNVAHDAVCGSEIEWLVQQGIYGLGGITNVNRPAINPRRGVYPDFPSGEGRGY